MGLIRVFQYFRRHQIAILMVHGVMDERDSPAWTPLRPQLSRDTLTTYLKLLSKRYHFVSLADAVDMLEGRRPIQPYCLVLTFDDGYRNNLTHALPILRHYHVPATFFIPTGFVTDPRPFWFDRLDYALQQVPVDGRKVSVGPFSMRLEARYRDALRKSYTRLRRTAKGLRISDHDFMREMEQLAVQLETESGRSLLALHRDDDWSAIMTWQQIQACLSSDVTFGSHTVDHIRLDLVEPDMARQQLKKSKEHIEAYTGYECFSLCYPNGNLTDETVALARECGYRCGLTTEEGVNRVGDDLMRLRRIDLPADTGEARLLAVLCGVSDILSITKTRLMGMVGRERQTQHDRKVQI